MFTHKSRKYLHMSSHNKYSLGPFAKSVLAASLVASPLVSYAEVTLSGNTITWPDDGWYQVQDSNTYEIICQGGRSCDVEDGDYFVDRFFDGGGNRSTISVGDSPRTAITPESFPGTLSISGKTISWSVDGWYQVLDGNTYAEICNGEASCSVPANGQYVVINHSLNLRTNVFVGEASSGSVKVRDYTIFWPDDGWYQVQNAETLVSLCEGGTRCEVQPGTFIVINHTSGERFNVEVKAGPVAPIDGQQINAANAESLIRQVFKVLNGTAYDSRMISAGSIDFDNSGLSIVSEARPDNPDNTTRERTYSCSNGGSLYENFSTEGLSAQRYSHSYDSCQIGDDLIDGDVVRFLPEGNNESIELSFKDYLVLTGTDERISIRGEYRQITSDKPSSVDAQNLVDVDNLIYSYQGPGDTNVLVGNASNEYDFVLRRGSPSVVNRSAKTVGVFIMGLPGLNSSTGVELNDGLDIVDSSVQQYFNRGKIKIFSQLDSSSLVFDADGGDESSATVTIASKNGVSKPFTIPWTKFQNSFRFK